MKELTWKEYILKTSGIFQFEKRGLLEAYVIEPLSDWKSLRRNPIEDGAISGFSGQKSVPE